MPDIIMNWTVPVVMIYTTWRIVLLELKRSRRARLRALLDERLKGTP